MVETISCFVLFVLLMTAILMLVNIVAVQNRVHYALTQTAQELSMYSYVLEATGAAGQLKGLDKTASKVSGELGKFQENIKDVLDGIGKLSPADTYHAASGAGDQVEAWLKDPKQTLIEFAKYGANDVKNALSAPLAKSMFEKYLENGEDSADVYLRGWRVIDGIDGMDFSETVIIDANGDIEIVVTYRVAYDFGALPLPFDEWTITQRAKTKAWLDGDGETYKKDGA